MSDDQLVIMPMPALVAVLLHKEQEKGSPLTEAEVLAVRDAAICVMTPRDVVLKLAEARGYEDIEPERAWEEWCAIRRTLI